MTSFRIQPPQISNTQSRSLPDLQSVRKLADIGLVKKLAVQSSVIPYNFAYQLLFQGGLYSGFFSDLEESKDELKIQISNNDGFTTVEDATHILTFQKNSDVFNLIGYGKKKLENLYGEEQIRKAG